MTKVVLAAPGADRYGSDLQLLESARALRSAGCRVNAFVPESGPLVPMLEDLGVDVRVLPVPVLRRTDKSVRGLVVLAARLSIALPRMIFALLRVRPDVVYVNTVTIPWWTLAARLVGRRAVVHVHEAESQDSRGARLALYLPLVLATRIIMISTAARDAAVGTIPRIGSRAIIVRNGVPDRPSPPAIRQRGSVLQVGVVARLSPRKGTMDALEIAAKLASTTPVQLHLFGDVFPGYEWYEEELKARASRPDLARLVTFHGYTRPVWNALDDLDLVLAPSHVEPFGNSVVEAQLSQRVVVASEAEGHLESIEHGVTGFHYPIGDIEAAVRCIEGIVSDGELAQAVALRARDSALRNNGTDAYRGGLLAALEIPQDSLAPIPSDRSRPITGEMS
ncbi:glycosyltransferase family 4 protein [Nocardioides fonticola]|uniref:Glycosyltransferase family 4 protein n=1 Tax=Nocardioides fonticola TaxID=450363 RepID=A0ABP7XAP7_9ACTN